MRWIIPEDHPGRGRARVRTNHRHRMTIRNVDARPNRLFCGISRGFGTQSVVTTILGHDSLASMPPSCAGRFDRQKGDLGVCTPCARKECKTPDLIVLWQLWCWPLWGGGPHVKHQPRSKSRRAISKGRERVLRRSVRQWSGLPRSCTTSVVAERSLVPQDASVSANNDLGRIIVPQNADPLRVGRRGCESPILIMVSDGMISLEGVDHPGQIK